MADILGQRATENVSQSIRKIDMRAAVLELEPSAAPLTVLTSRLNSEPTHNPEFSWQEDALKQRFDAINNGAGYTNAATSLVVDNGARFQPQDVVKVSRTGEIMRILAVTGNTLSNVTRGLAGGAQALLDNDELIIIGSAAEEGDVSKPAQSNNPVKVTNYTQIFKTPFDATETWRHSDTFTTPSDWDRTTAHAGIEHQKDKELTFWMSKPSELTGTAHKIRTTGGVFYYVVTNQTDAGGQLTETEFFGAFRAPMRYGGSNKRVAFASALAVDVLNGFPRGKLEAVQSDNDQQYGLNVMRYVSPHGVINVVTHWLLEGSTYGGYIAVLDLSQVRQRPLANAAGSRDTHIEENIQENDRDGRKDQYLTETGLEFGLEKTHALITGITS